MTKCNGAYEASPNIGRLRMPLDSAGGRHVVLVNAMDRRFYDPAERAREKEAARQRDEQALASGEKTAAEVHRDNAVFAQLPLSVRFPNEEW